MSTSIKTGFSLPADEHAWIIALVDRARRLGRSHTNRSEVIRAGLLHLRPLTDEQYLSALLRVPKTPEGRRKRT